MFKKRMIVYISICMVVCNAYAAKKPAQEFYEIKVYHFTTKAQETTLDQYLEKAYLPALHKSGIKNIGVFKPLANDTSADKKIYVFITDKSLNDILARPGLLQKDNDYITAAKAFTDAEYNDPPFTRMENIIIQAFHLAPQMKLPKLTGEKKDRVYELRSYEGPTDKLFASKVHMFNEGGEIPLFDRLEFNSVFYGTVISGSRMPNLMYMTSFDNMPSREDHWKSFFASPEWKVLSAKPEYQHTVSKSDVILMQQAPYSDF
ncbi:MAG: NIPSNAP family protein [Agriterribacter sp.]